MGGRDEHDSMMPTNVSRKRCVAVDLSRLLVAMLIKSSSSIGLPGDHMSTKFWEYYLAIEEDLANCSRYVEFGEQNYTTYSTEFAKIIVLASAEIDTILRELCELISPGTGAHISALIIRF